MKTTISSICSLIFVLTLCACGAEEIDKDNNNTKNYNPPSNTGAKDAGTPPSTPACGNGSVDVLLGETCDPGIVSGTGSCPTFATCASKNSPTSCLTYQHFGLASKCSAECKSALKGKGAVCGSGYECNGKGVCVPSPSTPACGNGSVDVLLGETCDSAIKAGLFGACPTSTKDCDDKEECTWDSLKGLASVCKASCLNTKKVDGTPCTSGVCKSGVCTSPLCGNGSLDSGELCDPAIPAGNLGSCPVICPAKSCKVSLLTGSACSQKCSYLPAGVGATCLSGKGTCNASGVCVLNTVPTPPTCGDGLLDPKKEKCDTAIKAGSLGACPKTCSVLECVYHYPVGANCQQSCLGVIYAKKDAPCNNGKGKCDGKGICTPTPKVVKCGDKICDTSEDCTKCPTDCGKCPSWTTTVKVECPAVAEVHVFHAKDPKYPKKGTDSYGMTNTTTPYAYTATLSKVQACGWGVEIKSRVPSGSWEWYGDTGAPLMSSCKYYVKPSTSSVYTQKSPTMMVHAWTNSEGNAKLSKLQLGCL